MNETRTIARFAHSVAFESIPRYAIDKAIDLLIDQLGIQIACATLPWSKQIARMVEALGGREDCTIAYYGFKTSPDNAAFLNTCFGHGFEMDDVHMRAIQHPGCLGVPPALALCEKLHLSGRDLLLGMIVAFELVSRVSLVTGAVLLRRGSNTHPMNGPFGIAAASARLLGLDEEGVLNAIGIAGSHCAAGLREYTQTGGSLKRLHCGIPAQTGVRSALLAREGLTGPPTILEGKFGFCRVFCDITELGPMVQGLGEEYMFVETAFKPYCTVYFIQAPIEAARRIIGKHAPDPKRIREIVVGTCEEGILHAGTIVEPRDIASAQYSTAFSLGLRFVKNGNGMNEYVPRNLADPEVLEVARKVRLEVDAESERVYPVRWMSVVTVVMEDGTRYSERVGALRGTQELPMTREEIKDKFRALVAGRLSRTNAEALLERIEDVERADDVAVIANLLVAR
ncbi:MAG TPA: MmgE/PrpD family protein [Ramlibacter sp.]|uniref:MmgE/PrpD family protein n=1 Tax=Ramlibacter sp. TaxID=1917967 RepID=UPI002B77E95D|nr:MmgE/PrpD family protein [Ramlibacter sp.]HVZ44922.1 MmgE/PrpD family protein [Ramlibacter sp.]